jgi:hypothetical protein
MHSPRIPHCLIFKWAGLNEWMTDGVIDHHAAGVSDASVQAQPMIWRVADHVVEQ